MYIVFHFLSSFDRPATGFILILYSEIALFFSLRLHKYTIYINTLPAVK